MDHDIEPQQKHIRKCRECGSNDFRVYESSVDKAYIDDKGILQVTKCIGTDSLDITCAECYEEYTEQDFEQIEY